MSQFEAIIASDTLEQWIETFQTVVDEARIHVSEDGLYAIPVDPGNVAQVEQTLHAPAFESFEATECVFGVDLGRLQEYVGLGDGDLVHLEMNAERGMLDIESGSVDFEMGCIDPDAIRGDGEIKDSIVDGMVVDAEIDSAAFKHAIKVVGTVTDDSLATIVGDPDGDSKLSLVAEGDIDRTSVDFDNSLEEGSTVREYAETMLSTEYLGDLSKAIPKGTTVQVQSATEWPLLLEYEYADGNVECGMLIAPRIDSSE